MGPAPPKFLAELVILETIRASYPPTCIWMEGLNIPDLMVMPLREQPVTGTSAAFNMDHVVPKRVRTLLEILVASRLEREEPENGIWMILNRDSQSRNSGRKHRNFCLITAFFGFR